MGFAHFAGSDSAFKGSIRRRTGEVMLDVAGVVAREDSVVLTGAGEQSLSATWHGDTLTGVPLEISAALNKAVGIVGADNDISSYTVPDNNVGWGRVDLDSSLYFAGDQSKLWVMDEETGLETGDSLLYTITVAGDSRPFRVSLCWSDYPGTMQAALILVNNLDLTVISPSGTEYKGNVYSAGQSKTGGIYDTLNVEESLAYAPGLLTGPGLHLDGLRDRRGCRRAVDR
jgi:hypothetical protein